ncbi:phage portal protein [Roseospira visakhapatnamensis]|uniref:HK97 family phage portal protein n=1 Tax=Roseospira visakhapatnamensis TaxID=390880 RepID=A0A7W6W8A3_9PROT|nr:phage portal protein [Roseospira visakhapatnamensis]MBB4264800.1 HK97 family phage portal protein [Roseospira visakhapatnamensis]
MSFFRRILGLETRSGSLGELEALLREAHETAAGIAVSSDAGLEYAPVLGAVRAISESVGMLPCHLYRRDGDDRRRADDHPLEKLLSRLPCPWTTAYQFKTDMTAALILDGQAFAHVARASDGRVLEVVPLPRKSVTVETDPQTLEPRYRLSLSDGTHRDLDRTEVFHLRGLGVVPNTGLSLIRAGRHAIGLGIALERHASRIMARGARPSGLLKAPGRLNAQTIERLKSSLQALHSGSESGSTAVLEEGMDFAPLTFNSVDMQFQEMRTFQVAEVSRILRVPLSLLSEMSRVTHANAESLGRQFLSLTLLPYLRLWVETIYRDLLTEDEREDYYAEHTTGALEMADLGSRIDAYVKAIAGGLMEPDEARARENLPARGGEAAKLRFPMNTETGGATDA